MAVYLRVVKLFNVLVELRKPIVWPTFAKVGCLSIRHSFIVETYCDVLVQLDFFFYFEVVFDQSILLR